MGSRGSVAKPRRCHRLVGIGNNAEPRWAARRRALAELLVPERPRSPRLVLLATTGGRHLHHCARRADRSRQQAVLVGARPAGCAVRDPRHATGPAVPARARRVGGGLGEPRQPASCGCRRQTPLRVSPRSGRTRRDSATRRWRTRVTSNSSQTSWRVCACVLRRCGCCSTATPSSWQPCSPNPTAQATTCITCTTPNTSATTRRLLQGWVKTRCSPRTAGLTTHWANRCRCRHPTRR